MLLELEDAQRSNDYRSLLTICLARTNHHGRFEALPNPYSAVHQWAVRGPCQVSLIFAFPFCFSFYVPYFPPC